MNNFKAKYKKEDKVNVRTDIKLPNSFLEVCSPGAELIISHVDPNSNLYGAIYQYGESASDTCKIWVEEEFLEKK